MIDVGRLLAQTCSVSETAPVTRFIEEGCYSEFELGFVFIVSVASHRSLLGCCGVKLFR
jgi:hypothetical protein